MSVHQILGKPGGGKGVYSVEKFIIEELIRGERPIITDMSIHVEPWVRVTKGLLGAKRFKPEIGMRNYLLMKYGKDFNIRERVFTVSDEQGKEIYLYRKNCKGLIKCEPKRDEKGRVVSYDTTPAIENGGVLYVSDEAWQKFGSRDWQETGKGLLYYAAQHRKLGDTWLIVTQNTKQIETQLRQVTQDFRVVKNHGKLKAGIFRQPSIFTVSIYGEAPTGGTQEPMSTEVFQLDKSGIGGCFDTASGVGMAGAGSADIGEKIKGLPWWILIGVLVLVGLALWQAGPLLGKFVSGSLMTGKKVVSGVSPVASTVMAGAPIPQVQSPVISNSVPVKKIEVTGRFLYRGTLYVLLSDGRIVTNPEVSFCSTSYAIINGERYEWHIGPPVSTYVREVPTYELPPAVYSEPQSTMHIFGERPERRGGAPVMNYPDYR